LISSNSIYDSNLENLRDKIILVTGGTGSFGNFITKELLKYNPREIRIYSRDEEKQLDMNRIFSDPKIKFIIGDVRDYERILEATQDVHLLYHAAALKIVPMCETHPQEALKTNVLGTLNVKKAAIYNKIDKSIFISTDKAVKPVNLYGMTKAIAEKLWINNEFKNTKFSVVRYGNVIGSRGSVIPFFKKLISEGKPLTITHQDMTRFLITLNQAIDLVFKITSIMKGGEIFVPDIPACRIVDLAKVLAGKKYPIEFTGIRPGEKIHECLIQEDEFRRVEKIENFYVIHPYSKYKSGKVMEEYTSLNSRKFDENELIILLKECGVI